jgi:hypothetical protein
MSSQDLINTAIAAFGGLFGWILRVVWNAVTTLQKDLKLVEREIHTNYTTKEDYRQDLGEIKEMIRQNNAEMKDILRQIFEKLDKKADK